MGWREWFNAPVGTLQKLDTFGLPPQALLAVAGMTGLTAWVGLLRIASLKPGDVVFVSAAAGAVGSVVCQIAIWWQTFLAQDDLSKLKPSASCAAACNSCLWEWVFGSLVVNVDGVPYDQLVDQAHGQLMVFCPLSS